MQSKAEEINMMYHLVKIMYSDDGKTICIWLKLSTEIWVPILFYGL